MLTQGQYALIAKELEQYVEIEESTDVQDMHRLQAAVRGQDLSVLSPDDRELLLEVVRESQEGEIHSALLRMFTQ